MPDEKVEVLIELLKKGQGATEAVTDLEKLDRASNKSGTGMRDLGRDAKAAFAVLGGTALLRSALNEFVESERAVARLNAALRSSGQFTDAYSKELQQLAKAFQEVTTFTDEAALNIISKLVAFGAPRESVERLTEAVLDFSTLLDKDVPRATLAMGKALQGEFGAFTQLGFKVDETATATKNFNSVLDQLTQKAGGQARAAGASLGGEMEKLNNSINDLKETIGKWAATSVSSFGQVAAAMGKISVSQNTKALEQSHDGLRKALEREVELMEKQKELSESTAAILRSILTKGFEKTTQTFPTGTPGGQVTVKSRNLQAEEESLKQVGQFIRPDRFESKAKPSAVAPVSTVGLSDADYQKAVELLRKYTADMEAAQKTRMDLAHEAAAFEIQADSEERKMAEENAAIAAADLDRRYAKELALHEVQHAGAIRFQNDLKAIGRTGVEAFSGGLSNAIISAFEGGEDAFQKFASSFLRQIAQMILQALILRAVTSALGGFGLAGGGQVARAAANGISGVTEVNRPTYFPNFNVLAGEAGREVMTVLARPRVMEFGGIAAQVGDVGNQKMAIVNAHALARKFGQGGTTGGFTANNGGGGPTEVLIRMDPQLRGEIVRESVNGAAVRVANDLTRDTPIAAATKRLSA